MDKPHRREQPGSTEPRPPRGGFLGHGLARRLFALFVAAALLPLVVSGWLSNTAVTNIAEDLNLRSRALTTRQTSRQVLDRLLAAKSLLAAAPAAVALDTGDAGARQAQMQSLRRVFKNLAVLHGEQRTAWASDPSADLARAWFAADLGVAPPRVVPSHIGADGVAVDLRIADAGGDAPRVLLASRYGNQVRWVAELNPEYLWAPLVEARDDSAWTVLDKHGRTLRQFQGADFPASRNDAAGAGATDGTVEVRSTLFLDGEFAAADWLFVQRAPRPQARWHGQLLAVWLGLVAMATLLAIALMSQRQIRRTLTPLQELTEGTRRLAAGGAGTRVEVRGDDELGTLALAFNDMAAHIDAQFGTLQGLAAIDRDILAGTTIDSLVERVLQRLSVLYPWAPATVSWRHGERGLMWAHREPGADRFQTRATEPLSDEHLALYGDQVHDEQRLMECPPAGVGPGSWPWLPTLASLPAPAERWLVLLPLREAGQTRALIALSLPAAPAPDQLRPAHELRDRLAVAFAARARENELVFRAAHDSLTGLANRFGLHNRIDDMLGGSTGNNTAAVLFLDLDHFKEVNDSHGHGAGDQLLQQASARLQACVPAGATLARQGGDEFAIAIPAATEAEACALAARAIDSLRQVFRINGFEHQLGASVGIAMCPAHASSRDELMRCADVALYSAKAAGRGQYKVFNAELDLGARQRVQLQAELRQALERSEFVVHYQPRVRPTDGVVTSAEALVRWQHPQRGLLYPGAFIELAESSGLIDGIGRAVLDIACAQMAQWRRSGVHIERVSVNVSPQQLNSGDLPACIADVLARHAVPASALEIEVTESLLVGNVQAACAQLTELRSWGVSIALDDFGTGYSSMATLRQLPIDVMKIDRSFVTDLGSDDGAMAVARAIVTLARSMGLQVVAEGIETEAQATVLRAMGCDEFQGYLYAKPIAPSQFVLLPGLRRQAAHGDAVVVAVSEPAQA